MCICPIHVDILADCNMFVIVINSRTFIIVHLVIFSKSIPTYFKWSNSFVNLTLKQYFPSVLHITPTQRQPGSTILADFIYIYIYIIKYKSKPPNDMLVFSLNSFSVLGIILWISIIKVSFHLTLLSTHFYLSILPINIVILLFWLHQYSLLWYQCTRYSQFCYVL